MIRDVLVGFCATAALMGCGPRLAADGSPADTGIGGGTTTSTTGAGDDEDSGTCVEADDQGFRCIDVGGPPPPPSDETVDVLLVIDNSVSMADEQHNIGRNLIEIVRQLQSLTDVTGEPLELDVQLMVTTTDRGGPLCHSIDGYEPAGGQPVASGCNSRIGHFNDPQGVVSNPQACTQLCPTDVEPAGDFIRFGPDGTNVPNVPAVDIDGDGESEEAVARAVACIGMQGIIGCEYGSPLESMLQAINPDAPWNQGPEPFMRDGAMLVVLLMTDEPDCSVRDPALFADESVMSTDPQTMTPSPSSAMCFNAAVSCTGPDADGVYTDCHSSTDPRMYGVERYLGYLRDQLIGIEGKRVLMGAIVGVPPVTEHNHEPPFQPTAGGIFDLVIRNWRDPEYPAGDILPQDAQAGLTAIDQQFRYGIGPGCTGIADGQVVGQATPPVRIHEVCAGLDDQDVVRCCIESICDPTFSNVIHCMIQFFPGCPYFCE